MRLRKQQANKLKRNDKLRLKAIDKKNVTLNAVKEKEADPNYDELYELSVEPEKRKRNSDEEDYAHYNDPVPGTYEMASDDWRHVTFAERQLNSSEVEPEWFDNIDLSNMTDSEIDRRFPTQEDDESSSDYSQSVGQKIKANLHKKQDSEEDSVEYEDDEGSGSGSYEDEEGSAGYEDEEYEGSDDYDQPDTQNRHSENRNNRKGKGAKAKNRKEHGQHNRKNKILRQKQNKMKRINLLKERIGLADFNNRNMYGKKNNFQKKSGSLAIDNLKTPHKIQLNKENGLKARKLNEENKKRQFTQRNSHIEERNKPHEKRLNRVNSEIKHKPGKSSHIEIENKEHHNENNKIDVKTAGKMVETIQFGGEKVKDNESSDMALKYNNHMNKQNVLLNHNTQTVDSMNSKTKNKDIKNSQNVNNIEFRDNNRKHPNQMKGNEQNSKDNKQLKHTNVNNGKEYGKSEKMKMDFEQNDERREQSNIDLQIVSKAERLEKGGLETRAVFHDNHNLAQWKRPIAGG